MQNTVQHIESKASFSREEGTDKQTEYMVLIELVQNLDAQIMTSQRFHIAALCCIPPTMAYFVLQHIDWQVLMSLTVVGIALTGHWAALTTKLTLQKLCWTRELRDLEPEIFAAGRGPFSRQQVFFEELSAQNIGWVDRFLMSTSRQKKIPTSSTRLNET